MTELDRRLSAISATGKVSEVFKNRAIVDLGDGVFTPPIRWGVNFAGSVNQNRIPSINEQVVMLNTEGGDCLSGLIIICSLHSPDFPAPETPPDTLVTNIGAYTSSINVEGVETVTATNTIHTSSAFTIKSGTLTIDAATIIKKTLNVIGMFTGAIGTFAKSLGIAGIDFKGHKHPENNKDGGTTDGAQK